MTSATRRILTSAFGEAATDPKLARLLRDAAKRKVTPTERREQAISYVYGDLNIDKNSGITKEDIRQRFLEDHGVPLDQHQALAADNDRLRGLLERVLGFQKIKNPGPHLKRLYGRLMADIKAALAAE